MSDTMLSQNVAGRHIPLPQICQAMAPTAVVYIEDILNHINSFRAQFI